MAILGNSPWSPDGKAPFIRQSLAVPRGIQSFWSSEGKGRALAVEHITVQRPDLVGKFDTIVLNPVDYEAVKKSMQETPQRDSIRRGKVRGARDLKGFDAEAKFQQLTNEAREKSK